MDEQIQTTSFLRAAYKGLKFGFMPIPLKAESKVTFLKWDPWLEELSEETIKVHWSKHSSHELGIIVGDNLIVYDADTPESLAKL
jgi:hypothetical protein